MTNAELVERVIEKMARAICFTGGMASCMYPKCTCGAAPLEASAALLACLSEIEEPTEEMVDAITENPATKMIAKACYGAAIRSLAAAVRKE